ncbi:cold shock domain-containing protein [Candidatus Methylobacter oryzae]|uniref:CSD domain-containing protein n=1 Tax=Candidatus Methylobacter oryzae TaxID=2497749 RepID=A0ABY3C901_9GAMM|nr:cold shock domain-containing protein [Candidatus Methylobacter oryzae]TRW92774.1 hypothetical protein EKO24_014330 [Candidatus Methylobacter oryzae]
MDNIFKGKLKRWNDDRGFGFISPENGGNEVFIHISALKNISRRPVVGDMILYQLHINDDGKSKAIKAKIDGVSSARARTYHSNEKVKRNWIARITFIVVLFFIGLSSYKKLTEVNYLSNDSYAVNSLVTDISEKLTANAEKPKPSYTCDGRTHCSQMTSCEEATFFITHCPGTEMDGDNDRIPCESQWCGH